MKTNPPPSSDPAKARIGIEVAGECRFSYEPAKVTSERVSSGIARFDTMLGGGYYRGANVLVTGSPGATKTTLGGAFAEAACERGERTLFVSFDSEEALLVVRLKAVQLELEMKRAEQQALAGFRVDRAEEMARGSSHLDELRGLDEK